ncbi:hypothetical protein SAMN04487886_108311 [Clostridium sp. DSM 8431]|uniref:hypothetical protein n=1 Tax=Clostridium sp. DSM 8431 TaxID=1761781 RepID=UPI0008E98188|nr:hypothetical protein [Clostridium sp. DSM 8431]SFU63717.1 hypothetical protein SAMN04487886_108311 [Clostridium sp. DSM 8431]
MNYFYGFDFLSICLMFLGTILNLNRYTRPINLILMAIILFRAFSKNTNKRYSENYKFVAFINNKLLKKSRRQISYNLPAINFRGLSWFFDKTKYSFNQFKNYKIVQCPNCSQKLRLPRGQKNIIVTCKRCKTEFKMKRT